METLTYNLSPKDRATSGARALLAVSIFLAGYMVAAVAMQGGILGGLAGGAVAFIGGLAAARRLG